jgi:hypothetical protein
MKFNNYPGFLTPQSTRALLGRIEDVRFSVDVMVVSIRFKRINQYGFLRFLDSKFKQTNRSPELHTGSKAWGNLFRNRTWFDVGKKTSMCALTEKVRALSNIDALLVLNNPPPKAIVRIQQLLEGGVKILSFALAGCELAFDFISTDDYALLRLQEVIKSTKYFAYGRVGFKKGSFPFVTNYINSRRSRKQLTDYVKIEDRQCLRIEFDINRRKANQQGLMKPRDLLTYEMGILDELRFYRMDIERIEQGIFDSNCDHYYSSQILYLLRRVGFHQAHVWARSQRGCPKACQYHNTQRCRHTIFARVNLPGRDMFALIVKCPHAKKLVNFRRDYAVEIPHLKEVKRMMKKAFNNWKR